ncbi:MAG: endolytic transglycosylase MltG [Patescibacteria group bacterium]|nr:endolytic transglycosylase MltG [Patescibacteria group bacterium]
MDNNFNEVKANKLIFTHKIIYTFFAVCLLIILFYNLTSAPSFNRGVANRQGTTIHIMPNESLSTITYDLEAKKVVKFAFVLKVFVTIFKSPRGVPVGDYLFKDNLPAWRVAWMLARGQHNVNPIKITLKEGMTNEEMATLLASKLSSFRRDLFLSDIRSKQGYLFPDTYFFFPLTTSPEIVETLSNNFKRHLDKLQNDISNSNHTLSDIIIMASIIQKEAKGESDAPLISGILWKRISENMSLQVDASKDTYTNLGLPPEPISNPGIIAIEAAIHPIDSPYLYYLHDKNGDIHFAKTYEEHKQNIYKYLK